MADPTTDDAVKEATDNKAAHDHVTAEARGPVVITWPAARQPEHGILPAWGIAVHDAQSGEPILDGFALDLRISLGSEYGFDGGQPIEVEITRLVNADGEPIGAYGAKDPAGQITMTDEYAAYRRERGLDQPHPAEAFPADEFTGPKFRSARFRYLVAEMRVAGEEQR